MATSVAHQELYTQTERERQAFTHDMAIAYNNLEKTFPHNERNEALAKQLAQTLVSERSRRNAHFYRYRLMTGAALMGMHLQEEGLSLPEASLLDMESKTGVMTDADWLMAAAYTGKGVSAELGHVDQLGDWRAGRELDDAIRALPKSETLKDAGFVFGDTYDLKQAARISYEFYISDGGLHAKRKRAAADVFTKSGAIYNIVKTSTYLVDEHALTRENRRAVQNVKRSFITWDYPSPADIEAQDQAFAEAGVSVIEPFISDKELRERSTAVLAATSLYFALVRHR